MANVTMTSDQFRREYMQGGDTKKQPVNRKVTKQDRAYLEKAFLDAWRCVAKDLSEPTPQWSFRKGRRWRLDFAWHNEMIAVEIQGGSFVAGGHNRGAQQAKDMEKLNAAAADGWTVLQFNTKAMGDPYRVAAEVAEVIRARIK